MATSGGGSVLSNLAVQKARVNKAKSLLGLSGQGMPKADSGGPPAKAPANSSPPQTVPQEEEIAPLGTTNAATPEDAQTLLKDQVAKFLQGMQGQPGVTPTPSQAVSPISSSPQAQSMGEQVTSLGADNLSREEQFYRIAGRSASPRELSIFSSRLLLEQQLGRAPTAMEMKQYITRPTEISPAYPVVFSG